MEDVERLNSVARAPPLYMPKLIAFRSVKGDDEDQEGDHAECYG